MYPTICRHDNGAPPPRIASRHSPFVKPGDQTLAPCSHSSRPLRAASGGGLWPALTSAARRAPMNCGRGKETACFGRTKKLTGGYQPGLKCRSSTRLNSPEAGAAWRAPHRPQAGEVAAESRGIRCQLFMERAPAIRLWRGSSNQAPGEFIPRIIGMWIIRPRKAQPAVNQKNLTSGSGGYYPRTGQPKGSTCRHSLRPLRASTTMRSSTATSGRPGGCSSPARRRWCASCSTRRARHRRRHQQRRFRLRLSRLAARRRRSRTVARQDAAASGPHRIPSRGQRRPCRDRDAGSQQVETNAKREVDGVFGLWYGKGPGVDRSGDALKHGNAYGSSPHGGVLVVAGDDHGCVSSSMPHQSDVAFMALVHADAQSGKRSRVSRIRRIWLCAEPLLRHVGRLQGDFGDRRILRLRRAAARRALHPPPTMPAARRPALSLARPARPADRAAAGGQEARGAGLRRGQSDRPQDLRHAARPTESSPPARRISI